MNIKPNSKYDYIFCDNEKTILNVSIQILSMLSYPIRFCLLTNAACSKIDF